MVEESACVEHQPKPKRRWPWIVGSICLIVAVFCGVYASRFQRLQKDPLSPFQTPTPSLETPEAGAMTEEKASQLETTGRPTPTPLPTPALKDVLGSNTLSIVLMGVDSDQEREKKGRGWRSDTIAILVIDVETPSFRILSIPRDTRAKVRRLNEKGKVIGQQYNKINAAFHYGGGPEKLGHENLIYALNQLLFDSQEDAWALHYYASIDMEGVAPFTDAVGGVPITLAYDMPGFGKKGETITLQGEQAQKFVRLRHGVTGGSDLGRISRQQDFVQAFTARVRSLGVKKVVLSLWQTVEQYVHTNLSLEQILVLGDLLSKLDMEQATFDILPGKCKTIDSRSYYVPNSEKMRQLVLTIWGAQQA